MRTCLLFVWSLAVSQVTTVQSAVPFFWGVTGTAGASSSLYVIHPSTGVATLVGSTGKNNVSGISIHPASGQLYATQGQLGGTKSLLILNRTTGTASTVGDLGEAVADTAFTPGGVFYLFGAASRDLQTANLGTAAKTLVKTAAAEIGGCGITFDAAGKLFLNRSSVIRELNPATGDQISQVLLAGATTDLDNLLVTRSDGVLIGGQRTNKAAPTRLFSVNPASGATVQICSVPLSLSGLASDTAAKPVCRVRGATTVRIRKNTHTLRGTYSSKVPGAVASGKTSVKVKTGAWRLTLRKLRRGTNRVRVVCADVLGQKVTRVVRIILSK